MIGPGNLEDLKSQGICDWSGKFGGLEKSGNFKISCYNSLQQ